MLPALLALSSSSMLPADPPRPWVGFHMFAPSDPAAFLQIRDLLAKGLKPLGVNALILEFTSDSFAYQSVPELKPFARGVGKKEARELASFCRSQGVRLIPQLNCVGHQSWAETTYGLLKAFPEIDETPGQFPDNKGIYCRSWCTSNPKSYQVVFRLIDELLDAFQADAFHVGMDEVFLIGHESCPRCKGKDPGELFANAVKRLHAHLKSKRATMLMWGDRLLDGRATGYGEWEASTNGTHTAIDRIPKDIVVCDWHYEQRPSYPSLELLQQKGFRVWPAGWRNESATAAFLEDSRKKATPKMLGHLFTTWGGSPEQLLAALTAPDSAAKPEGAGDWWSVGRLVRRFAPQVARDPAFGAKP